MVGTSSPPDFEEVLPLIIFSWAVAYLYGGRGKYPRWGGASFFFFRLGRKWVVGLRGRDADCFQAVRMGPSPAVGPLGHHYPLGSPMTST